LKSAFGEPRLILVVDDNQVVAMTLAETLREAGFAVLKVNSGSEAMMLIEQAQGLAAVVTDIRLEAGTDGWAVAERARDLHPDIAVIYISGNSAHLHPDCGVADSRMLQKPFLARQIIDAVSGLIERPRPTQH
jgi:CheY-like chemotaxis protein